MEIENNTQNTQQNTQNNNRSSERSKFLEAFNRVHNNVRNDDNTEVQIESENEANAENRNDRVCNSEKLFEENIPEQQQEKEIIPETVKRQPQTYSLKQANFWCFICEKEFRKMRLSLDTEIFCPTCGNITEEIEDENDHPKNYQLIDDNQEEEQEQQIPEQPIQNQQQPAQRPRRQNHSSFYMTSTTTRRLPNGQVITQTIRSNRPNQQNALQSNGQMPQSNSLHNFGGFGGLGGFGGFFGQRRNQNRQLPQQPQNQQNQQNQQNNNSGGFGNDFFGGFGGFGQPNNVNFNFFGNQNPFLMSNQRGMGMNTGIPQMFRNLRWMTGAEFNQLLRNRQPQGPAPAQTHQINSLKTEMFTKEQVEQHKGNPCAICQEDPKEKEKITTLPCKHHYHEDCVKKWLKMHNSCPVCRKSI